MDLFDMLRQVRMAGLGPSLRTLKYTLYLKRTNAGSTNKSRRRQSRKPGRLESIQAIQQGILAHFERAELELYFLAPDLVRVSWSPGLAPIPYGLAETEWPDCEVQVCHGQGNSQAEDETWPEVVRTQAVQVQIGATGALSFSKEGEEQALRIDEAPAWHGEACSQTTRFAAPSGFFGLGEQATHLERSGRGYELWNNDPRGKYGFDQDPLYTGIPTYLVLQEQACQLVFYENSYRSTFNFQKKDDHNHQAEAAFEGGMLRYYWMTGSLRQVYERYSQLCGRAPLPPVWALGYHQSRWGYKSADEIRQVAAGFDEHQLPLSAIHLDIDYMDGYRVFSVDPVRFPDLAQLAEELDRQGVKLVTIIDPGVKRDEDYEVYQRGLEAGVFCRRKDNRVESGVVWPGWSAFPDFSDPAARDWWGKHYRRLLEAGVAGFWHDMNEPTSFTAWGDMSLPANTRHAMEGRGGDHREAHNLYGLLMNRAGYEALREQRPDRRPWILSRSGWAGMQRHAWSWTADVETSWPALQLTIATVLGLGLSGQPYCGPDIGGFGGDPPAELYLRWLQMAAFMPFCRTHSANGTARREPWAFDEPTTRIVRDFLDLRSRLMPYLYSLAWQASQTGAPIVRPLFWLDPGNPQLWEVEDCFLLGDSLLVAPVLEAEAQTRTVRLPAGNWYSFWDDERLKGPEEVELPAPLERIPLLVRAGSLLPMTQGGNLILQVYPPSQNDTGDGILYSDAGEGYGPARIDQFSLSWENNGLRLNWQSQGSYPFPYPQIRIAVHGFNLLAARADGQALAMEGHAITSRPFQQAFLQVEPKSFQSQ
jgi:alpha-glucosidase